ncbi:MAG: hypothetical protein HGA80_02220 [Candidatus Omnitrophica bacterium]|nr:hypothetical protein [Candidatus Omnitrophota bacterium]
MVLSKLGNVNAGLSQTLDVLKSLSFNDVKYWMRQKKFELLAVGIVFIAIVVVGFMFSITMASMQDLEGQKAALQEKTGPISKYKEAVTKQEDFMRSLPQSLGEDNFIKVLTDMATRREVRITDFTPPVLKSEIYYKSLTSKITFTGQAFQNIILFIRDLEQSSYAIKVNSWSLRLQQNKAFLGAADNSKNAARTFVMDLVVSAITIEAGPLSPAKK